MPALLALVVVTAVWGVRSLQVKDAVAISAVLAFLARPVRDRVRQRSPFRSISAFAGSAGAAWSGAAFAGVLLAAGCVLQTLRSGSQRGRSVSSAGFVTGMYVVLTPIFALAIFRIRIRIGGLDRRPARDRGA